MIGSLLAGAALIAVCVFWESRASMPMIFAPLAGIGSDKVGTRPFMAGGLLLTGAGLGWLELIARAAWPVPGGRAGHSRGRPSCARRKLTEAVEHRNFGIC